MFLHVLLYRLSIGGMGTGHGMGGGGGKRKTPTLVIHLIECASREKEKKHALIGLSDNFAIA